MSSYKTSQCWTKRSRKLRSILEPSILRNWLRLSFQSVHKRSCSLLIWEGKMHAGNQINSPSRPIFATRKPLRNSIRSNSRIRRPRAATWWTCLSMIALPWSLQWRLTTRCKLLGRRECLIEACREVHKTRKDEWCLRGYWGKSDALPCLLTTPIRSKNKSVLSKTRWVRPRLAS